MHCIADLVNPLLSTLLTPTATRDNTTQRVFISHTASSRPRNRTPGNVLYSIYIMSYAKRFIWRENRPLTRTGPRRTVAPISTALQIITRLSPGVYVIITRRLPSHTALHRRPGFKIITCDRTRTEPGASPDRGGPDVALTGSASGPLRFRPDPAPVHRQVNRSVRSRRGGRGEAEGRHGGPPDRPATPRVQPSVGPYTGLSIFHSFLCPRYGMINIPYRGQYSLI